MSKQDTLLDLKKRVGEQFGLNTNEFVLKRYNIQREFKNLNSKLYEFGLTSGALIKVERGKPHQDGVFELSIVEVRLNDNSDGPDEIFFEKLPLFKIEIKPDISAVELKHKILE